MEGRVEGRVRGAECVQGGWGGEGEVKRGGGREGGDRGGGG